jgi:predicted secreted hydrolase
MGIQYTGGTGVPHRRFEDEFLSHRKCSEWWYSTSYLEDEENRLYSFQFTLARIRLAGVRFYMLLTAVTDIASHQHYYTQYQDFLGNKVTGNSRETAFGDVAGIQYSANEKCTAGHMELAMKGKEYTLKLQMQSSKVPVWHCEDGKLQMGILDDPRQVTYYFSMTNLAVQGEMTLNGNAHKVKGKAWFDRQGGTCKLTNPLTNWEWFSLRFFDNEEIMLFSFPQNGYTDGTYIKENGSYRRLARYQVDPQEFFTEESTKFKFSCGWKVLMPGIKEEEYLIRPMADGQFNVFFFELLAEIINRDGKRVGYCVVELLPGARNKKLNPLLALK